MIKIINGIPVLIEVKYSNLNLVMTTKDGHHLWLSKEGKYITDHKRAIMFALRADRNSSNPDDVCMALKTELNINLAGGWREVIEDKEV